MVIRNPYDRADSKIAKHNVKIRFSANEAVRPTCEFASPEPAEENEQIALSDTVFLQDRRVLATLPVSRTPAWFPLPQFPDEVGV
jgi:hypothetical protein